MARFGLKELNKAVARLPKDAVNPMVGGSCVYTKGDQHCIVGAILTQWGLVLPKPNSIGFGDICGDYEVHITEAAQDELVRLQYSADHVGLDDKPRSWGQAIKAWRKGAKYGE